MHIYMKITRKAFAERFGVHVPDWSGSAWVKGIQYEFVDVPAEIEELELLLLGGVIDAYDDTLVRQLNAKVQHYCDQAHRRHRTD
jgi:hypothetical protein